MRSCVEFATSAYANGFEAIQRKFLALSYNFIFAVFRTALLVPYITYIYILLRGTVQMRFFLVKILFLFEMSDSFLFEC